jgi:hypothetical protein
MADSRAMVLSYRWFLSDPIQNTVSHTVKKLGYWNHLVFRLPAENRVSPAIADAQLRDPINCITGFHDWSPKTTRNTVIKPRNPALNAA